MDFFYRNCVIVSLLLAILILIYRKCYSFLKVYFNFPVLHVLPLFINYHINGNVRKDLSFSEYLFQNIIAKLQPYTKEGIVLTHLLRPMLIVFSEEPIKALKNKKIGSKKPHEYNFLEQIFGPGLITSNGKRWEKHRKMLNPSFQLEVLKERVPLFNEHGSALIKDMETFVDRPSVDPLNLIKFHYFCALNESVFGLKQCEENKTANMNYLHIIDNLGSLGIYMYAHPWLQLKISRYFSSTARKFHQMQNELFNFTKNVITEMKKCIYSNETSNSKQFGINMQKSLTYILLQHHFSDPSFSFEDLHAEVTTFMAAGYDTVSYSTMWCLFMLGLYPEIQEKAFNEVNAVPQDYISYEECCNFKYLEAVIMETLRLYPTIPAVGRETTEEVQFGKCVLPKGTYIGFLVYLWHRNPETYPDPEKFDPERFYNKEIRNSWDHIPFAEGSRSCIGKKFAVIEMKIFLAYILRKFKIISLVKRESVVLSWNVVLTPSKPLYMRFLSR